MVYFIGAGPGAPDLITVRGKKLLEEADVVIYAGSLVNPEVLAYTREDCRRYDSARMHLGEVLDVMRDAEKKGLRTVRLHSGDPSLYGAIREQIDVLRREKIPFEICPGVSSFSGAAAALETEYTLPGISQSVIITRAEGRTPVPESMKLPGLASHGATMVLFLSSSLADKVSRELQEGGMPGETPAAIVYRATWPQQKVFRTTVAGIAEVMDRENIKNTALIVVGKVLGAGTDDYELSKLYDAGFTTAFREAIAGSVSPEGKETT